VVDEAEIEKRGAVAAQIRERLHIGDVGAILRDRHAERG